MDQNKNKETQQNYLKNLDDYIDRTGKFNRVVDNPVYDAIKELGDRTENEKRQKWERASALMGLNSIFSTIGGGIAAFSGVKPSQVSNEPFNYAMAQIDKADKNTRDDYNRYYKSVISEAIRKERRKDTIEDNYIDGLESVRKDDKRESIYSSKMESDLNRQLAKDRAAMDRLVYSNGIKSRGVGGQAASMAAKEKPEMYVKSNTGRRVPLYRDDVTKLYQIGKMYEIDNPYKSASSDNVRKREFDVLMQRAYLIYERDKKAMDDSLNSDIKSSDPYTLKIK